MKITSYKIFISTLKESHNFTIITNKFVFNRNTVCERLVVSLQIDSLNAKFNMFNKFVIYTVARNTPNLLLVSFILPYWTLNQQDGAIKKKKIQYKKPESDNERNAIVAATSGQLVVR